MKRRLIEWVGEDDGSSRVRLYEDASPESSRFSHLTLLAELHLRLNDTQELADAVARVLIDRAAASVGRH